MTAFGIAFAPSIEVATLDLGLRGEREIHLKVFNAKQARIAGVRQFRYAAFVIAGTFCLRQLTGYSHAGVEVYRGSLSSCGETEPN